MTILKTNHAHSAEDKKHVLTKAIIRLSERLNLSRKELAVVIGRSEASLSRMSKANFFIDPESKEGQLSLLLLRLYRSLDTLFGGNKEQSRLWLRSKNKHLRGVPIDLIQSIEGLVLTVQYLDAMRGKN